MIVAWQEDCMLVMQVKWPAVLVGSSIGASTAIDFALHHPEATLQKVRACDCGAGEAASSVNDL